MPTSTTSNLKSFSAAQDVNFANSFSIDFPSMPDVIDLTRDTDYAVEPSMIMPDGMHQYRSTRPLEIPFSFSLHFQDSQYCKKGSLTLLEVASRLHSFALPISTYDRTVTIAPVAGGTPTESDGQPQQSALRAQNGNRFQVKNVTNDSGGIFAPVTCMLQLIYSGPYKPGINCIGYVKNVSAKLKGPWLRGPNGSYNMPTSADYSFTFMHNPAYGNTTNFANSGSGLDPSGTVQAFADDVQGLLYNTRGLVSEPNYQGLRDNP